MWKHSGNSKVMNGINYSAAGKEKQPGAVEKHTMVFVVITVKP